MTTLNSLYSKTIKRFGQLLREIAYLDMFHQASDWVPEALRSENKVNAAKPIQLNFNIPKKNRLHWISRTIQQ